MKIWITVFSLLFLTSCASNRKMSRDEFLKTTSRTYENKNPEEVLAAVEKIFMLSDGDDYTFVHTKTGMLANRKWLVYLVFAASTGTDSWNVQTEKTEKGTLVQIYASTTYGTVAATSNASTGVDTTTIPSTGNFIQGNSLYDLFYKRLDYLLGKSDKWTTCLEFDQFVSERNQQSEEYWGLYEALCNGFNINDKLPETIARLSGLQIKDQVN